MLFACFLSRLLITKLIVISQAPANYAFGYAVQDPYTYNEFGHQESRSGHVTKGSYSVLLPDGRKQVRICTV